MGETERAAQRQPDMYFLHGKPEGYDAAVDLAKVRAAEAAQGVPFENLRAAIAAVNSLIRIGGGRCRELMPDAAIECITDGSGKLIYRCNHAPPGPHRWPA